MSRFFHLIRLSFMVIVITGASSAARAQVQLLMLDEVGCVYCEQWSEEIGDAYHKTAEGKIAPILRIDIRDELPEYITLNSVGVYTPTFILLVDGQETGRITGYPGEDFFWWMLEVMLDELPETTEAEGS